MIKIESALLEDAYTKATIHFNCSLTEISVEVIQYPSQGFLGLFKKSAIIVASRKHEDKKNVDEIDNLPIKEKKSNQKKNKAENENDILEQNIYEKPVLKKQIILNDTILPDSFVSDQDEEDNFLDSEEDFYEQELEIAQISMTVKQEINELFTNMCFDIDVIDVKVYDDETLLIEFNGEDCALLIGKEGYRYKALSYMIFNWINSKYQLQLRLEIAEFLTNQEDAISKYLSGVCEIIDRQGRAQTKILDGVLIQIALKQLRLSYPDKYVAVRSTRDGLKYIIINDYHNGY